MRIILASALLLVASAPAFATTYLNGTVDTGTNAQLDTSTDPKADSSSSAIPTTIAASSTSFVSDGTYTLVSYAYSNATWVSADAGTVGVEWGWSIGANGSGVVTQANTNAVPTNWSYTFTATGNGNFSGNYVVVGSGAKFGLQSLYSTNDLSSVSFGGNVNDPTSSGSFAVPLVNGQTYTMAVFNYGNIGNIGGFDAVSDATAVIDWTITYDAVPEPASWAMMIAGFGLVGAGMRRRRMAIA